MNPRWLRCMSACLLAGVSLFLFEACQSKGTTISQQSGDWIVLFDGTSVSAWRGYKQTSFPINAWIVDGKALKTVSGCEIDLITREQFKDFELELEWRVAREANGGILFRVSEDYPHTYFTGPEMQVLDDDNTKDGQNPKTTAGSLCELIAPHDKLYNPYGQWNKTRIVVQGPYVEYWLNDAKVVEYELGSDQFAQLIKGTKFENMPRFAKNSAGHIALQNHGGEVWYRNIRIRRL